MANEFDVTLVGLEDLLSDLKDMVDGLESIPNIKVGVDGNSSYPDGTPVEMVGMVNEFGSDANNIPERSFLRSTISENEEKYVDLMGKNILRVLDGRGNVDLVWETIGLTMETDVKRKITDISSPANSAKTIARKGSSSPLIDTGLLRRKIIYEVDKDGG